MSEDPGGSEYDLRPPPPPDPSETIRPKPGEPGWVPPIPVIEKAPRPEDDEPPPDPDIQQHKAVAILAYIFFLIPLLAAPHSRFARFHANQGLLLFITWFAVFVVIVMMNFGWAFVGGYAQNIWILWAFFSCVFHLVPVGMLIALLLLMLMGIVHAANGEMNKLPVIGNWILIK